MQCPCCFLHLLAVLYLKSPDELTLEPRKAATYLGGTINFTCYKPLTNLSMAIGWKIVPAKTGLVPTYLEANNRSTTELPITFNSSIISSSVICLWCFGLPHPINRNQVDPVDPIFSNYAMINLQGILSEVNVTLKSLGTCVLQVYWNPPFTLKEVPIQGYNVNVTNLDTNVIVYEVFTRDTNYDINLGYYDYEISIAGVNDAGEGNITYVNISSMKLQNQTISVVGNVTMSRNDQVWMITATFIKEKYACLDEYPISFHICKQDEPECWNATGTQTKDFGNKSKLTTNLNLTDNQHYYLTIFSTIGKYNLSSRRKVISTFDVQSIDVSPPTSKEFCVTLHYAKGSVANAILFIKCDPDILVSHNVSGRNKLDKNSNTDCQISLDFSGNRKCTLMAYDEVNGVIQNTTEPAVVRNVTLPGTKDAGTDNSFPTWGIILITAAVTATVVILIIVISVIICYIIRQQYGRGSN